MKRYKIYVGCNHEEIERVLTTLFNHGFVLFSEARMKKFADVKHNWGRGQGCSMDYWNYISTGDDKECKMVLNVREDDSFHDYLSIALEDFVKFITK